MRRTILAVAIVVAVAPVIGCGGNGGQATPASAPGSTSTATTQSTAPVTTTTGAPKNPKPVAPVVSEMACGKVFFAGLGTKVAVSATGVPCKDALTYAMRFVSTEQPQQRNLPAGWRLADCTGINQAPPTPGEPNSPRCGHGKQAFTIHFPQG